jgi:hypothetical protein
MHLRRAIHILEESVYRCGLSESQWERIINDRASSFGIITAWRDKDKNGRELSRGEKEKRNEDLIRDFGAYGWKYMPVKGVFAEFLTKNIQFEESFLVWNPQYFFLKTLAEEFEQESFIFKPLRGPTGYYDLSAGTVFVLVTQHDVRTTPNQPRMKKQKEVQTNEKHEYEEQSKIFKEDPNAAFPTKPLDPDPRTMDRNMEIRIGFSKSFPLTDEPIDFTNHPELDPLRTSSSLARIRV